VLSAIPIAVSIIGAKDVGPVASLNPDYFPTSFCVELYFELQLRSFLAFLERKEEQTIYIK
jgi:hypothetical protein